MTRDCAEFACGTDGPNVSSAKAVDFADFQGPPAASAYFDLAKGPMGREGVWPRECRWSSTICEELFFPQITLPVVFTNLDPGWASCSSGFYGDYIWDPPLVLDPTAYVPESSITVKPEEHIPKENTRAVPGLVFSSPTIPATPNSRLDVASPLQTGFSRDDAPVALFTVGADTITASILPDESNVLVGSHTLQVGGPPFTTAGVTVSFGRNGRLEVVRPAPITAAKTISYSPVKDSGAVELSLAAGTTILSDRNGHTKLKGPSLIAGKTVSVDRNERPEFGGSLLIAGKKPPSRQSEVPDEARIEIYTLGHGRRKKNAVSLFSPTVLLYLALTTLALTLNL
jgi:hypothetical protein